MDLKSYDIVTWIDKVWDGLHTLDQNQLSEESWDAVYEDGDYVEIEI